MYLLFFQQEPEEIVFAMWMVAKEGNLLKKHSSTYQYWKDYRLSSINLMSLQRYCIYNVIVLYVYKQLSSFFYLEVFLYFADKGSKFPWKYWWHPYGLLWQWRFQGTRTLWTRFPFPCPTLLLWWLSSHQSSWSKDKETQNRYTIYMYIHTHTPTYIHSYMYTYTHAFIHTHTQAPSSSQVSSNFYSIRREPLNMTLWNFELPGVIQPMRQLTTPARQPTESATKTAY